MTKGRAIEEMLRWLDEATANGQAVPPDQIADLKDRANYLLDGVVKFLAGHFKIPAVYSVVRAPVKNLLSTGFTMTPVVPPETYEVTAEAGKSFYIEVMGAAAVTVTAGSVCEYELEDTGAFQTLKDNIPMASGSAKITVVSDYPFVVRNAAIYPCAFATDEAVQDYIPYVPYEMPDDYREFDTLMQTSDAHNYRKFPDFRKENLKTFLLPYNATGQFDFHYFRNPADIPPDAPLTTKLETYSHAAQLIPLKLAVDVCMGVDDTMTVGYYLDNKFQNTLVNLLVQDTEGATEIETIYTM